MAAPKENLLPLGHLTGTERNTFTKRREHGLKKSVNRPILLQADFSTPQSHQHLRAMHLQQRWQELKERELTAQQHNRQLLQQFEKAQDTLREMLTLTAAMKTIRMEYERYLEESTPRWQQQLKEKTEAAKRKRMEEYLKSYLKNADNQVTKSSADQPLLSQGPTTKPPQKKCSPYSHLDYNQDGSSHLPYMQSSWQTHPHSQTARFPIRVPYQPQDSPHVPPSFHPPPIFPHPFQHHHHPWPRQNPPARASPQPDWPWSWTTGIPPGCEALWGQLYTEEPPPERGVSQVAGEAAEMSRALSSKRERGGESRSSHFSQELDLKAVRLSSSSAESSKESSQRSSEKRRKREKRGRSRRPSSDRERCSSQESSRTSSVIVTAAVTVAQSSESEASSEKGSTSTGKRRRRSAGLAVGSPRAEEVANERSRSNGDDSRSDKGESPSTAEESRSEDTGVQSPEDKSESCGEESQRDEESGSVSIKIENGGGDEIEKEESSSSEESSVGEKDEEEEECEKDLAEEHEDDGEEKVSQRDEEQEERGEEDDDEASEKKNTTDEEEEEIEEQESEEESEEEEENDQEEKSDRLKIEDEEHGKQDSSSQDEEVDEEECEGGEDQIEEDGESDEEEEEGEEEEQRRDEVGEAEEERDSEDSIISPQNKSQKMHIIPEEASEDEDEEGSKTGSSDSDSDEVRDEDIEHLLAPQEQSQKKGEKDLRADEKPKATCDKVEIFKVEQDRSTKTDQPSESEEFDDFYD
ncbi:high mobility group nucleosome-binding domain-containing protein 5-like [Chaetodon trifascialis]|uniref:high mobility group nucleosome-binding domain-containing protein 5-like n=1 Tax=Chaetodon trifascialis TaxID=109706 RepID=UPI0039969ABB